MNPAVVCHYFPPGLQLPPQPLRGLLPVLLLGEQTHNGCEQFAQTVTRQRRDCDLNLGCSAPESSTLTTRLPSHLQLQFNYNCGLNDCSPRRSAIVRRFDGGFSSKVQRNLGLDFVTKRQKSLQNLQLVYSSV